jgi:oligopeptide transport system ATP-binding protein
MLLEINDLKQYFRVGGSFDRKTVRAVDGVSFGVEKGETFGLVGESGCGKTTLGRSVLRLHKEPPTGGSIVYNGNDITTANMKPYRKVMQMVFQDPYSALDPRMTVGAIIGEALDINKMCASRSERSERIAALLKIAGLNTEHANRYPHEFSGGQRQRVGIVRALATNPEFIVCDEPISALDVSIRAQIINLLMDLQERDGLTYLFIAHDLSVVRHISRRIGVMYLGKMVELAESDEITFRSVHPYTQSLISAIPIPDPREARKRQRVILEGDVPSPVNPPSGCRFRTRCPRAEKVCALHEPQLREVSPAHFCACHLI